MRHGEPVILWLNGPFGAGKTTAAQGMAAAVPGVVVHDPERYGAVLLRTVGRVRGVRDFQEIPAWRRGTVRGVGRRHRAGRTVVVPMSVLEPSRVGALLDALRGRGHDVVHVTLHVSPEGLDRRIAGDARDPGAAPWRRANADRYAAASGALRALGPVLDTDARSRDDVVAELCRVVGAAARRR